MKLELAREEDLPRLLEIEFESNPHAWSPAQLREAVRENGVWVWRGGSGPTGESRAEAFCVSRRAGDELEIHELAVSLESRRRGLASRLLRALLELERGRGCRAVWLEVRAGNGPARALYRSLGFREAGLRAGYYSEPREDALVLSLALEPPGAKA